MTEEQLQEHSYPRPHPEGSGRALVHNVPEKKNTDREGPTLPILHPHRPSVTMETIRRDRVGHILTGE